MHIMSIARDRMYFCGTACEANTNVVETRLVPPAMPRRPLKEEREREKRSREVW